MSSKSGGRTPPLAMRVIVLSLGMARVALWRVRRGALRSAAALYRKTHQPPRLSQRSACEALPALPKRATRRQGMLGAMANPFGIELDDRRLRWAAAEGVPESVIAAICLLHERSVGEIVARLTTRELEQVINIAGRSPQIYPPGAYETLKEERDRLRRSVGGRSQRCSRCKNKSMGDPKNKRE
jgi:hypothetical protein